MIQFSRFELLTLWGRKQERRARDPSEKLPRGDEAPKIKDEDEQQIHLTTFYIIAPYIATFIIQDETTRCCASLLSEQQLSHFYIVGLHCSIIHHHSIIIITSSSLFSSYYTITIFHKIIQHIRWLVYRSSLNILFILHIRRSNITILWWRNCRTMSWRIYG